MLELTFCVTTRVGGAGSVCTAVGVCAGVISGNSGAVDVGSGTRFGTYIGARIGSGYPALVLLLMWVSV